MLLGLLYDPKKAEFLGKSSLNIDILTVFFRTEGKPCSCLRDDLFEQRQRAYGDAVEVSTIKGLLHIVGVRHTLLQYSTKEYPQLENLIIL